MYIDLELSEGALNRFTFVLTKDILRYLRHVSTGKQFPIQEIEPTAVPQKDFSESLSESPYLDSVWMTECVIRVDWLMESE